MDTTILCRWLVRLDEEAVSHWLEGGLLVPLAVFSFDAESYEQFVLKLRYDDLRVRPDPTPLPDMYVLNPQSGKSMKVANTAFRQHSLVLRSFLNGNTVRLIDSTVRADFEGEGGGWRKAYCRAFYRWLLEYTQAENILLVDSERGRSFSENTELEQFRSQDLLSRHSLR